MAMPIEHRMTAPLHGPQVGAPDFVSLALGAVVALALGVFAFHPASFGLAALAVGLLLGAAFPLAGITGIALTITTLPLVMTNAALSDIRADELLIIAVIAGAGIRALLRRDLPRAEVTLPYVVFIAVAAVSIAARFAVTDFSIRILAVVLPLAKHAMKLLLFLGVMWAGSRLARGVATMRVALVAGGILGGLLGVAQSLSAPVEHWIAQHYFSVRGTPVRLFWGQRAFAAFDGNPNHLAVSMLLLALVALAASDHSEEIAPARAWFLAATPMLFGIVASASRATYVVAAFLFLGMWLRRKREVYGIALGLMGAYTLIVPNLLRTRLVQLIIVKDGGISSQSDVVKKIGMFLHPVFRRETLAMTDNYYLDVLVNFWPLALAAFLWLMWVVFRRLWEEHDHGHGQGVLAAALLSWVAVSVLSLNGAFFTVPRVAEILWLIVGWAWAWLALRERPDRPPAPEREEDVGLVSA